MLRKISSVLIILSLTLQQIGFASIATELNISGYLSRMSKGVVTDNFRPVHIRFFSYDVLNDNIKVMLDKGDVKELKGNQVNQSTEELLNYFLVGLSLPNDTFWVNLRPDSEDKIIDNWLANTDVGKIMLEADLQLKKDTALFTSPATPEGRVYWDKLYKKAAELYGYDEVSIPTLTRPWIVPNEIIVRETKDSAYIYKATLKVMLEQDYLKDSAEYNFKDERSKALNEYSSQLIRELIIPKLTKEVNLSKRYAALRQVYYSIILSRWFKARFSNHTGKYTSRIDRKDLSGLTSILPWSKSTYFEAYKKSFSQGEYNVKETVRTPTGQVIRTYFSGGIVVTSPVTKQNGFTVEGESSSAMNSALKASGLIAQPGIISAADKKTKITAGSPLIANKNIEFLHSVPEAVKALANKDLTGINVLIRVNVNVPSKDGGIADPARIIKTKQIGEFILARGGTPIFFGHNGSLDKKTGKDKRESLVNVAKYMKENFFPNLMFNENSITEQGVQIGWSDIKQGAPNLLQNVRSADDYEVGPKRMIFAKSLARLAGDKNGKNKILIVDAFGDVGSSGGSVELIPFLMDEVYTGPEMANEFNDLEQEVQKGFDAVFFGGIKSPKLNSLEGLNEALNPGGFMFIASGLTPALEKEKADLLKKLRGRNPERVLTTIDYSDETGNDIGPQTLEMVLARSDALRSGQRIFVNGTMGNMEDKSGKYTVGTDKVWAKLRELAQRGVKIIVVGGDAGSTTVKYKLDKEPNVKTYSGGGVAFSYIANEDLVGLRAPARRHLQLENEVETGKRFNVAFNGARGRMGLLYLQGVLENLKYKRMRVMALNGIPLNDIEIFVDKLTRPDTTYGPLFPKLEVKVEKNVQKQYAILEITGFANQDRDEAGKPIPQRIVVLDDRKDAIRWNIVSEALGEEYLIGTGIMETSGQDLEAAKSIKRHLTAAPEGLVVYGAPPKGEGVPIAVFGVNEEEVKKDSQVLSNASCTTNCIAPVAKALHAAFGVIKAFLLTIHSETSDQASSETFRGDEPGRGRPGHKVQSPAKTGAATLLPKLIAGIGPNDGKAIRVGTLTGSVVVYSAELEKPATVKEIQDLFVKLSKDNPRVFGIGHNLASKDIVKDQHSTIVDLDSIQVSPDGKKVKVIAWYDNEWGYAQRGLDMFLFALEKQASGERTEDFNIPAAAAKKETKVKTLPANDLEGLTTEGALPMFIPAQKSFTGKPVDLYLTGIKEKKGRGGQIILRMLLGDTRFNLKAIVVEGITNANFEAVMKAFAQSIINSADLGNLRGIKVTPELYDNNAMVLKFEAMNEQTGKVQVSRVKVLPKLPENLGTSAKVIDVAKLKYSYAEMIKTIEDFLKPINAELFSAAISMSTRPGGELLDSGKGISVAANILPERISELDKIGIMYSAYQVPVDSGSYLVATFTTNGLVDKETIHKLIGAIPGIEVEDTTSNHFVGNRSNIVYDKSQTVIIADKKTERAMVSLFFLVNEELNSANKALENAAAATSSSAITRETVAVAEGFASPAGVKFAHDKILKAKIDQAFQDGRAVDLISGIYDHEDQLFVKQSIVDDENFILDLARKIKDIVPDEKIKGWHDKVSAILAQQEGLAQKRQLMELLIDNARFMGLSFGDEGNDPYLFNIGDITSEEHRAIVAHGGSFVYESNIESPRVFYLTMARLSGYRNLGEDGKKAFQELISHLYVDLVAGQHVDQSLPALIAADLRINEAHKNDVIQVVQGTKRGIATYDTDRVHMEKYVVTGDLGGQEVFALKGSSKVHPDVPKGSKPINVMIVKADVGSIGGHGSVPSAMLEAVADFWAKAAEQGKILDFFVTRCGDDISITATHTNGKDNPMMHKLAWDSFIQATVVSKDLSLYGAGQDLLADSFSGNIKGAGPGIAEMEFVERPSEPFIVLQGDKWAPGGFNEAINWIYADPNSAFVALKSKQANEVKFGVIDFEANSKQGRWAVLDPQKMKGLEFTQAMKLIAADQTRYSFTNLVVDNQDIAAVTASRLHNIAGEYTGKDDPMGAFRTQGNFPAEGIITAPFFTGNYKVFGWMMGSQKGWLLPVSLPEAKIGVYDGPPLLTAFGFNINNGRLVGFMDLMAANPAIKAIQAKVGEATAKLLADHNFNNQIEGAAPAVELAYQKGLVHTQEKVIPWQDFDINSTGASTAMTAEDLNIAKAIPSQTTTLGRPALRVDTELISGAKGRFVVPAGTSTGEDEAKTVGVPKAIENIAKIQAAVTEKGLKADQLVEIGQLMLAMGKDNLGAEATLGYQMSTAWAVASQKGLEHDEFIREIAPDLAPKGVPDTDIQYNITNGGEHAKNSLDLQEFMVVPKGKTTAEANKMADNVDRALGNIYRQLGLSADPDDKGVGNLRGKEGGYKIEDLTIEKLNEIYQNAASFNIRNLDIAVLKTQGVGVHEFVLNCQIAAIKNAGYTPSTSREIGTVALALDSAATSMLPDEKVANIYNYEGRKITSKELVKIYADWVKKYPILSIEDGLSQNDWDGWMDLIEAVGDTVMVITDDITVSQAGRLLKFIQYMRDRGFIDANNKVTKKIGILIKLNQNGFLTTGINDPEKGYLGTIEVVRLAKQYGIESDVSHRSNEAEPEENEVSIADFASGVNAKYLKSGDHVQAVRAVKEDRQAAIDARERAKVTTTSSAMGGIDFKNNAMMIKYQPMGNFAGLNLKPVILSKAELARFDIDKELAQLETMASSGIVPSGERIEELAVACSQKGEMAARRPQVLALLVKVGIMQETQCCMEESSLAYKKALVFADSLA